MAIKAVLCVLQGRTYPSSMHLHYEDVEAETAGEYAHCNGWILFWAVELHNSTVRVRNLKEKTTRRWPFGLIAVHAVPDVLKSEHPATESLEMADSLRPDGTRGSRSIISVMPLHQHSNGFAGSMVVGPS